LVIYFIPKQELKSSPRIALLKKTLKLIWKKRKSNAVMDPFPHLEKGKRGQASFYLLKAWEYDAKAIDHIAKVLFP